MTLEKFITTYKYMQHQLADILAEHLECECDFSELAHVFTANEEITLHDYEVFYILLNSVTLDQLYQYNEYSYNKGFRAMKLEAWHKLLAQPQKSN